MEDADVLNLDELDQIESSAENKLKVKNRFQNLSEKVRIEAQEKEKAQAELKAKAEEADKARKEAEFYRTFSQLSAKYPKAAQFQDQILERVNKGYDQEEAVLAVLAKEGSLETQAPIQQPTERAEGGSAMTQMFEGDKTPDQLNSNEKLERLLELEKSGELQQALRAGINRS